MEHSMEHSMKYWCPGVFPTVVDVSDCVLFFVLWLEICVFLSLGYVQFYVDFFASVMCNVFSSRYLYLCCFRFVLCVFLVSA